MNKQSRNEEIDRYTFEEKLSLIRTYREHLQFKRFHKAYVIYYPLVDRENPENIEALFEVLLWRLSLADEDDHFTIPTY